MAMFRALVLHDEGGKVVPRIETVDEARLPAGEVTVAVEYSTLNYKDGMILQGIGRLVRNYPHVPGVDFAGTVERSDSPEFKAGDPVILTGWRVGEAQWGGYAEKARVPASYLVRRPGGLSARQALGSPQCSRSSRSSGTACSPARAMSLSPAPRVASAASRWPSYRGSGIAPSPRPVGPTNAPI
jgi:D-arabinose 1-dehydrogenase-like Zn-dependent alcohol dehydrogenase